MQLLAKNLVSWIGCNFVARKGNQEESIEELAGRFLRRQGCSIVNYKVRATQAEYNGLPNCETTDLTRQLSLLFHQPIFGVEKKTFAMTAVGKEYDFGGEGLEYEVSKRKEPVVFKGRCCD